MRIFFNRNSTAVTDDIAARTSMTAPVIVKHGDSPLLQIGFHRDGTPELPTSPLITFIVKELQDYLGAALILTNSFSVPADVTGYYVGYPDLTSATIYKELVTSSDIGTDVANDAARHAITGVQNGHVVYQTDTGDLWIVTDNTHLNTDQGWSADVPLEEYIDLAAEIVLRESPGFGEESSQTFTLRIYADYEHGNEVTPVATIPFSAGIVGNRSDITALTGGGAGKLDGIATVSSPYTVDSVIIIKVSGAPSFWRLTAGTAAEDAPGGIVRPDDYDGTTNQVYWQSLL